jgi:hypothetical protein
MIKPFKLFKGYTYSDEYTLPIRPENISHRHWNMLPNHVRNSGQRHAELYIAGWEACLSGINVNPFLGHDDFENREVWNWGYVACMNRRTRVYTERDMEYYHTEEFLFFDVSEERYGIIHGSPYKVMLYRSIEEGNTVEGQTIYPPHPMYNFPDIT